MAREPLPPDLPGTRTFAPAWCLDGCQGNVTKFPRGLDLLAFAFCTIVTLDYLPFAATLAESVREWAPDADFHALVACSEEELTGTPLPRSQGIGWLSVDGLRTTRLGGEVYERYYGTNLDAFRWAAKPSLIAHLLSGEDADGVIFLDGDIQVSGDCTSLMEETLSASVLLTPHWHQGTPTEGDSPFFRWFRTGLYNAGLVGATRAGLPALEWWHRACVCACEFRPDRSVYYDQKYLDLLPLLFDGVKVSGDRRYNVGGWRMDDFLATCSGTWPLPPSERPVFLHFTCFEDVRLPGPCEQVIEAYSKRLQANGLSYSLLARIKEGRAAKLAERRARKERPRGALAHLRSLLRLGTRWRHLREMCRWRPAEFED